MKLHTICFLVHAGLSSPKKIADAILSGQTFFADPFEPCKLQRLRYLMAIIANRNLALCKTSIFRHFNLNVSIVFFPLLLGHLMNKVKTKDLMFLVFEPLFPHDFEILYNPQFNLTNNGKEQILELSYEL